MDRLTAIEIFVETAKAGSFTAVADKFQMTPAMIGKYIKWLETRVGARLLHRNTRRQHLTEAGQQYLAGCQALLLHYQELEQRTLAHSGEAIGRLRINAPVTFGCNVLTPLLCHFMTKHPQIRIELELSDTLSEIVGDGFDLLFRVGIPHDGTYIAREFASMELILCASPAYLANHGSPKTLSDLAHHRCLGFLPWLKASTLGEQFSLEYLHLWDSPFMTNHGMALKHAALTDAGIILQPLTLVAQELSQGHLIRLLPEMPALIRPIYMLYPARESMPYRLRLLIDYLLTQRDNCMPRMTLLADLN